MYYLTSEASFDAAHFLKDYQGKCRNIHGHRWRIVATVQGSTLNPQGSQRGMLMDFGDLKADLKSIADKYDHSLILEIGSLKDATLKALQEEDFHLEMVPFRTTAENFARHFYTLLTELGYSVRDVAVYETPTNCAIYDGEQEAKTIVQL